MEEKSFTSIGYDILASARSELTVNMPYLSEAISSLLPVPGDAITVSVATDGAKLYFSGNYLASAYMRSSATVNRGYLHVILHCMLRHIWRRNGRDVRIWNLACDVAVESIMDELPAACVRDVNSPARQLFYGECRREMKVLTAESISRMILRRRMSEYELARLERVFLVDDHGLWEMEQKDDREQAEQQWESISSRTQTAMETALSTEANGGETVLERLRISARNDVDYRAFLKRFAVPREILKSDDDAFDYIFYTYGLQHYGNMPLIEPPETKEEKRIEDFVIAIDTSMSTSGELVKEFLRCTYSVLRSTETFTRRLNIRILQCDDRLRSDTRIDSMEHLKEYMDSVELSGGSATDFRPVFEHVAKLQKEGAFSSLRGLIYFTDGMGRYPVKRPPYDVAFVLLEEPPINYRMPPWCIRILLDEDAIGRASAEVIEELRQSEEIEELPDL